MRIQDRPDVTQAVPGDGRDLGFRASGNDQSGDCPAPRVMKGKTGHVGPGHGFSPRRREIPCGVGHRRYDGHSLLGIGSFLQMNSP